MLCGEDGDGLRVVVIATHQPALGHGFLWVFVDPSMASRGPGPTHIDDVAGLMQSGEWVASHVPVVAAEREHAVQAFAAAHAAAFIPGVHHVAGPPCGLAHAFTSMLLKSRSFRCMLPSGV